MHGSLFEQAERVFDLLYSKYLVAPVSYDRMTRVERFAYPPNAVRELLCNALVHSNWARGIPIQIKVLPDMLVVSNVAVLPRGLTEEKLLGKHRSEPYNPLIAQAFYRAGYIESWGRGMDEVREACEKNGDPMVSFDSDDSGVMAFLKLPVWWDEAGLPAHASGQVAVREQINEQINEQIHGQITKRRAAILSFISKTPPLRTTPSLSTSAFRLRPCDAI